MPVFLFFKKNQDLHAIFIITKRPIDWWWFGPVSCPEVWLFWKLGLYFQGVQCNDIISFHANKITQSVRNNKILKFSKNYSGLVEQRGLKLNNCYTLYISGRFILNQVLAQNLTWGLGNNNKKKLPISVIQFMENNFSKEKDHNNT